MDRLLPVTLGSGGRARPGSERPGQPPLELHVSVLPRAGRGRGTEDRKLEDRKFRPVPCLTAPPSSLALPFVTSPGTPASSTADAVGGRCFTVSGAFLGIRACGLRAKMPGGVAAPG